MKKEVLLLFSPRFTEFHYYKYEISKLESEYNIKVIIHDLSNLTVSKKLNEEFKTKLEKKTLKFTSLISWVFNFSKMRKKKIIIFNFIQSSNFNSFIINLLVRLSKLPVAVLEPSNPFSKFTKKNTNFFLSRIKQYRFNYRIYLFHLKRHFFRFLINFIKYKKVFILSDISDQMYQHIKQKKNSFKIDFNSYDYSNALSIKENEKKNFENYIIYIDNGAPYFSGDAHLRGDYLIKHDLKKRYDDLNFFFDELEKYFNAKVVVIPHPKYKSPNPKKIKSLNPYFNNRIVNNDYDSLAKLSPNCLFFINQGSTAVSYAIFHHKPIIHIFSSQYFHVRGEFQNILDQSKNTGHKPIDICKFNKQEIMDRLTVNKSKYEYYKYHYLTPKNKIVEKVPNYKIIENFIEENFNKIFS